MLKKTVLTMCAVGASLVAASSGTAAGSPVPDPGTASCQGHLMAISNHASGADGASGNEKASAGPGYFLHSSTHEMVADYVDSYCG